MPDPTEQKYWLPGVAEAEEVGSGVQRSLLLELPGSPGCLPSAALLETGWPLSSPWRLQLHEQCLDACHTLFPLPQPLLERSELSLAVGDLKGPVSH